MKHHATEDAVLAIFKGFVSRAAPSLELFRCSWHHISRTFLAGLWALAMSCGVAAEPYAYITNSELRASGVSVVDTASNVVVATIPLPSALGVAVSPNGDSVYVTGYDHISVISKATNSVTAVLPITSAAQGVVVSPNGAFIYVTHPEGNYVSVIETATLRLTATVPVGRGPYGLDVTPNGAFVYVANIGNPLGNSTVTVISTATNTVAATVPVGVTPVATAVTPNGAFVYVANRSSSNVTVIATASNTVVATVPIGEGNSPESLAIALDGTFVYVTNFNANLVGMINTSTNALVNSFFAGGSGPTGLSITPDGAFIYVAHLLSNTVSVFAVPYGGLVATIRVGGRPYAFGRFIGPSSTSKNLLATEGNQFNVNTATVVRYGTTTRWVEKTVSGTATCSNAFFGTDPAFGILKSCVVSTSATASMTPGSFLAVEDFSFAVTTATLVRYGTPTRWVEKMVTGNAICSNAFFDADPAPKILKSCIVGTPITTPPSLGLILADEDATFAVSEPSVIIYGAETGRIERTVNGTVNCSNAFFGVDPAPGFFKSCIFVRTAASLR